MLTAFWNIWLELSPWMLLGAIAAGLLHVVVPAALLQKHLTGRLGVLKAVAFGIPLPLCSCGVIPVGIGLRKSGASSGAVVGFLISTPQTGVDSILVSGSFLGWPFAILKVVVALITGVVGGTIADLFETREPAASNTDKTPPATHRGTLRRMLEHSAELIRSIWGWLVIGVIVSAIITWLTPEKSLADLPGMTGFSSLLIALVISLPLYICATASVPVAAALVAAGLSPGAALVFLMAGPATNVATLGAVYRGLGGKTLIVYLITIVAGSLLAGMLFNDLIVPTANHLHSHEHSSTWWRTVSAIVLAAVILRFAFDDLKRWLRNRSEDVADTDAMSVSVQGMTCDGCAARLQRELEAHPDIERADVSFAAGNAVIHGEASEESVTEVIRSAGFETSTTVADKAVT